MKYKKVLIGLDMGTDSVGWCVTDENGDIIKKNGKSLWGYSGFDEAKSCEERSNYRRNRRRLNRRRERIDLLRGIFAQEINKIDNSFYYRLDNSFYKKDDLDEKFDYLLFNDSHFTDKDYYKKFPTIYHLRKYLVNSDKKEDIRLIYLALHHMIKYRGNFLNDSEEFKAMNEKDGVALFDELNAALKVAGNDDIEQLKFDDNCFVSLKKVNEKWLKLTETKEEFCNILNPANNKFLKDVIIPLIVGGDVSVKKLKLENITELETKKLNASRSEEFDSILSELCDNNPNQDGLINVYIICKKIYEYFLIGKILGKHIYLCDAMVERYDNHKQQLIELKRYVKNNYPEKMDLIFRVLDGKINNYAHYIGSTNYNHDGVKKISSNHIPQKDFYKFLKDELCINNTNDDIFLDNIINDMNNNRYLDRQNSVSNGIFPYQLNKMEMKKILMQQSKYYPFLLEESDGLNNIDKIISILEYKIPYYVGPLINHVEGNERSKYSWVIKRNEKIYPWNYKKIIDMDSTAKEFINRMLTKCSYIPNCYCLPKNSLLFSYYDVLSTLNKLMINGKCLNNDEKISLINDVFKKKRKVTKKDIQNYFKTLNGSCEYISLSTVNNKELRELTCNMSSYYDFSIIFGEDIVNKNRETIENIIRDIVIFEDKKILEKRLKTKYKIDGNYLDEAIVKKIKSLSYNGYSNISRELLEDIYWKLIDEKTGEVLEQFNIIQLLEKSSMNLQEALYDEKYKFIDLIDNYNRQDNSNNNFKNIEEYVGELGFVSPGMKRPMIQAYKICEEVEKIVGQRIDEYYVECTRTNKEVKQAKSSRKDMLIEMYKNAIKIVNDAYKKELEVMKKTIEETEANKFQSDKVFLYFTQMGKCMYSGDPIDISELHDSNKWDIDHIIPQSLIKDDSITNRVLVRQEMNRNKGDSYPLDHSKLFINKETNAKSFYTMLKRNGLISEEKYRRLTLRELTESELDKFVNRQLVYTNQAVKGFVNAIRVMKSTDDYSPKVVYVKGENISDFRKENDIIKSRNINNFHHAHDAYLNIIVGRTIDVYFSGIKSYKIAHEQGQTTNFIKIFNQNDTKRKKNIFDSIGGVVWDYDNSLKKIKNNIYNRFDILSTERVYFGNTLFDKVQILPAGKGNIPVKCSGPLSDCKKYGGLLQYAFGSYSLIKVKDNYIIEAIPSVYRNKERIYLDSVYNNTYEVIIDKLKINTVFKKDKTKYVITGKSGNSYYLKNKNERFFDKKSIEIIHKIEKLDKKIHHKSTGLETLDEILLLGFNCDEKSIVISPAANDRTKAIILTNDEMLYIYDYLIDVFNKDTYNFSQSKSIVSVMRDKKEQFSELSILGKTTLIMNILDFLKCNVRADIDLSLIGGAEHAGILMINKKVSNCEIIYESITGFYSKVKYKL